MESFEEEHAINQLLSAHGLKHVVEYMGPAQAAGARTGALVFAYMPGGSLLSNRCALLRCLARTIACLNFLCASQALKHACIWYPAPAMACQDTDRPDCCRARCAEAPPAVRNGLLRNVCRAMAELHRLHVVHGE